MDILGGIAAIKQTLDITKELRSVDARLSDAEYKLRIADLVEKILEAREALNDAKDRERELLQTIERLGTQIQKKEKLFDFEGLLYESDINGKSRGNPYCNFCYVKEEKLFRVTTETNDKGIELNCPNCDRYFETSRNGGRIMASRPQADNE